MSLPIELLQRRPAAERYDVVVVGAGIAGLACAAILARGGARVALCDAGRRPGGRLQTIAHQGFAVDLGAVVWEAIGFREALAVAGVSDLGLAEIAPRDALRVAVVEGGRVHGDALALPVPGTVPSPSTLDAVRVLYGIPPRVYAELGGVVGELVSSSAEQLSAWRETTLDAWVGERHCEPVVAAALRRLAVLLGALDPAAVELAGLVARLRSLGPGARAALVAPADNPVAGTRGVIQALVDAFVEAGGELRLGTRVVGLSLDRGRLRALAVQREEHPFLDEIAADRCVLAVPEAALGDLLPRPMHATLEAATRSTPRFAMLGLAWAFREPPAGAAAGAGASLLRLVAPATGSDESTAPGVPPTPVTLVWPTAYAPRTAPPGQALLVAHAPLPEALASDVSEVARVALLARSAVRALLSDVDELLLWERQWLRREALAEPLASPALGLAVPGCDGVLLAGAAVGVPHAQASGVAAAVLSARAAAERVLAAARPDA